MNTNNKTEELKTLIEGIRDEFETLFEDLEHKTDMLKKELESQYIQFCNLRNEG